MKSYKQDPLRKLARSPYYQNLYVRAKDLACIHLFANVSDFSKVQMEFLYWLAVYYRLYHDLAIKENRYLTEDIIQDDRLCDCYLIWEIKQNKKKEDPKKKQVNRTGGIPSIVFTRGAK